MTLEENLNEQLETAYKEIAYTFGLAYSLKMEKYTQEYTLEFIKNLRELICTLAMIKSSDTWKFGKLPMKRDNEFTSAIVLNTKKPQYGVHLVSFDKTMRIWRIRPTLRKLTPTMYTHYLQVPKFPQEPKQPEE